MDSFTTPLPSGTVTFLFTDIEGSTRLWEEHAEVMDAALARHDALAAALIPHHHGVLVKQRGEGDSLFAVFARALDAVAAAMALQRVLHDEPWPVETPLRVRIAVHTGDATVRDGDYFGAAVNRCARLRSAAHGGQVLLSTATQELVRDHLVEGESLRDLGEYRLKDLARPERIFQLVAPDLPADFEPLKSLDARHHNLPVQRTSLLGREQEVAAARALLLREEVGLVTMTGPGGTGKTRLGLQVAAELLDDFQDGVFFVALAPVSDPGLVASTIAQSLEVRETSDRPLRESLKEFLQAKQLLLLLDNFEQVVAAAPLVAELLAEAPRLKVLVTSRAALHLRGEKEFPVSPLSLPVPKRLPPVEQLSQYASVELFIQRALDVKPDFSVTNENAPAVAEICCRLDGLPLAIELAAARIRVLPPQAILSRLESRLKLLVGGARDLPARQQTLRGAIAWSYDLLEEAEKTLFRRLAVFVGGCTLEAVEAVCNMAGDLQFEVLDGIASLVDKNLLQQDETGGGEPRFGMLETIREYGLECLAADGETAAIRRQHANSYLALAERAEPELEGPGQAEWLERLEKEHDNLRAAITWSQEAEGDLEMGVLLAGALAWFWHLRGYWSEGRGWLESVLTRSDRAPGDAASPSEGRPPAPTTARARALYGAGIVGWPQGDWATASPLLEASLAIWRERGEQRGIGRCLSFLGGIAQTAGDPATAHPLLEESVAILREVGDRWGLATSLFFLALEPSRSGDDAAARALFEESLTLFRKVGDRSGIATLLNASGEIARNQGDYRRAAAFYDESLALNREIGDRYMIAVGLQNLGSLAIYQGDPRRAAALLGESLGLNRELGYKGGMAASVAMLAGVVAAQGQLERAARLLGAADGPLATIRGLMSAADVADEERRLATVRAGLSAEAFAAAWAAGQAMTLEQAVDAALAEC